MVTAKAKNKVFLYRMEETVVKERLARLKTIVDILDSDMCEYEKAYEIAKIYDSPEKFRMAYSIINKYGQEDPRFDGYISRFSEIYSKLMHYQENGVLDSVKYVIKYEDYFNSFKYAKFVVTHYLEGNFKEDINLLYDDLGIDEQTFKYCLKVVAELEPSLFEKYESFRKENRYAKYYRCVANLKDIANGIRTGKLSDGTVFDVVEFWRLLPFKYSNGRKKDFNIYREINPNVEFVAGNFPRQVEVFTRAVMPEDSQLIMDYMRDNAITGYEDVTERQLRHLYSRAVITTSRMKASTIRAGMRSCIIQRSLIFIPTAAPCIWERTAVSFTDTT